jgi:magnesium transporter
LVQIISYRDGEVIESDDLLSFTEEPSEGLIWLDFFEAKEEELDRLASILDLHPVAREELSRPSNRPKLADHDRYFAVTIHVPGGRLDEPHSHEIDIVVGQHWIVTVHEQKIEGLLKAQGLCKKKPEIMAKGSDFLLQEILEALLDRFMPLLDWLDNSIESLEEEIIAGKTDKKTLPRVTEIRKKVAGVRRTLLPQREVLLYLSRKEISIIQSHNRAYYHDLYERLLQSVDMVDRFRDNLTHLMDLYMNQVSRRMNQVMKVLTIWATIFLPLTFLTGVWGMNFRFMPELAQPWAYWAALGLMAAVAIVMIVFFKLKKWL